MPFRVIKARLRGGRGRPPEDKLEALNDKYSRIVSLDLNGGLTRFADKVNYDHMADAVYSGNYQKILETIPLNDLQPDILAAMDRLGVSVEEASRVSASQIPFGRGTDKDLLIDSRNNPKLDEYLDVRSAALVTNITDNLQVNIQAAVRRGVDLKLPASDVAEQIKQGGIGLNYRQETALFNYKESLKGTGLSRKDFNANVRAYGDRLLDQRCSMIARTEVSYAQNYAQLEVWNQAKADGLITDAAQKIWVVDGDPCPICQSLNGDMVGLDEQFETEDGDMLDGPPAHPHCRCSLGLSSDGSTADSDT